MAENSGFDALLDALKKSGMDINKDTFAPDSSNGGTNSQEPPKAGSANEDAESPFTAFKGGKRQGGGKGSGKMPDFKGMDIETPLKERMQDLTKKGKIVLGIVLLIVLGAAYWWFHPPINIQSEETWGIIVVLMIGLFLVLNGMGVGQGVKQKKAAKGAAAGSSSKAGKTGVGSYHKLSLIPVVVLAAGAIGLLLSQSFFPGNAEKYSSILDTQSLDFAQDIPEVDYSQIPVIDRDTAIVLGNKEMGAIADYVSQFEISSLYSQIDYKGSPVRVSPLGYADLFKWLTNREPGIPAYALVNMTTQDAEIVRLPEGQAMKYSQSEPLARNIDRYVQLKYPFYMFDEKSFEIDEDGHPWWICPVQKKTIGLFGGTTISRVVMVDASSGECQDLDVSEVPSWVDRVYPSSLLITQYNWYGSLNNGWINSWLGQQGVVKTTPGYNGMLGYNYLAKDGDVWVYTGVTSATSDSSIIGFILINQRTQESHFYSIAGATETSAMESAEGQVQNLRYKSTFPILINVLNQPTYFMALKDGAGLVKKFAMIDIQRYQNVAVGDTVAGCQEQYEILLTTNGVIAEEELDLSTLKKASGTISRIAQAVIDGNTHFYVTLEGDSTAYDFALPNMLQIVTYQVGDTIEFRYVEGTGFASAQSIETTASTPAVAPVASNAAPAVEPAAKEA